MDGLYGHAGKHELNWGRKQRSGMIKGLAGGPRSARIFRVKKTRPPGVFGAQSRTALPLHSTGIVDYCWPKWKATAATCLSKFGHHGKGAGWSSLFGIRELGRGQMRASNRYAAACDVHCPRGPRRARNTHPNHPGRQDLNGEVMAVGSSMAFVVNLKAYKKDGALNFRALSWLSPQRPGCG